MSYQQVPARTSSDANAAADVNQLQANLDAIKGGTLSDPPVIDLNAVYNFLQVLSKKDIDNLIIKNNVTNYNYQLDISFTGLRVEDKYLSSISTTIDITTGLDTGTEAVSTWYYIWIFASAAGDYTFRFSTSYTSPTAPSGYTRKRLIGAVYNDASGNFRQFHQKNKDVAMPNTLTPLINATASSSTKLELALYVPKIVTSGQFTLVTVNGSSQCSINPTQAAGYMIYVYGGARIDAPCTMPLFGDYLYYYAPNGALYIYFHGYSIGI